MTLNASAAVVGVVYLTPKDVQLRREPDREDVPAGHLPFRRLRDNTVLSLPVDYTLRELPAEAAVSPIAAILGRPIDQVIDAVTSTTAPLSDDALDELAAADTRPRVQRAIAEEVARRKMPGPVEVEAAPVAPVGKGTWKGGVLVPEVNPAEVAPPIVVVAQGTVDVEEIPLVADEPRLWWWHDEAESYARLTRSEVAASPDSGLLSEVGDDEAKAAHERLRESGPSAQAVLSAFVDDLSAMARASGYASSDQHPADVVDASADEQTDAPFPPEVVDPTISATSGSGEVAPAGGDTSEDDATTATTAPSEPVAPPEAAPAADLTTTATKPAKERPRGWCPACRQFLTVRAEGGMMQHYTPDGAKGADGKRLTCTGVGLTPAAERPPGPHLPLPVALGLEPLDETIARPALVSPSTDPVIAAAVAQASDVLALKSIREHDADTPPVAVAVPAPPSPIISRYTVGGSAPYGWIIFDLVRDGAMCREDGTLARWEHEADAREALVYVREHGELPGDVVEEPPVEAVGGGELETPRRWTAALDDRPDAERPAPTVAAVTSALDTLVDHVARAKQDGVRIRIVIEPIE